MSRRESSSMGGERAVLDLEAELVLEEAQPPGGRELPVFPRQPGRFSGADFADWTTWRQLFLQVQGHPELSRAS